MNLINYHKIKELSELKFSSMDIACTKFGMKRSTFYENMQNEKELKLSILIKISNILECGINDILIKRIDFDHTNLGFVSETKEIYTGCGNDIFKQSLEAIIIRDKKIVELEDKIKDYEIRLGICNEQNKSKAS
jgi:DNA-binding Xre family transcriptional regulator